MPELPEIEILRRDLEKEVVGRRVKDVDVRPGTNSMKVIRRHGRRKDFADLLVGAKFERAERRGRRLVLGLDNGRAMVVDLGPDGRLLKTSSSDALAPHTHVVISFTIGGQLRYADPTKRGEVFVADAAEAESGNGLPRATLDPLDGQNALTWQHFYSLLEAHDAPLKDLLMNDEFVCGLGELYSDEVLFVAGIRHDRPANRLSSQDVRRLYRALMETMHDALKARGTSLGKNGFRDLQGAAGSFQLELKVYERDGEPCPRCRHGIEKQPIDGTVTYFCPQCQS